MHSSVTRCETKKSPKFPEKLRTKSSYSIFYLKVMFFKIAQKVTKYLGYFGKKICWQNF